MNLSPIGGGFWSYARNSPQRAHVPGQGRAPAQADPTISQDAQGSNSSPLIPTIGNIIFEAIIANTPGGGPESVLPRNQDISSVSTPADTPPGDVTPSSSSSPLIPTIGNIIFEEETNNTPSGAPEAIEPETVLTQNQDREPEPSPVESSTSTGGTTQESSSSPLIPTIGNVIFEEDANNTPGGAPEAIEPEMVLTQNQDREPEPSPAESSTSTGGTTQESSSSPLIPTIGNVIFEEDANTTPGGVPEAIARETVLPQNHNTPPKPTRAEFFRSIRRVGVDPRGVLSRPFARQSHWEPPRAIEVKQHTSFGGGLFDLFSLIRR